MLLNRRHKRYPLPTRVSIPGRNLNASATEISVSGCRIETDLGTHKGTRLPVLLKFPDGRQPIPLEGEVVWSNGNQSGIRFINTPLPYERRLLNFLGEESRDTARSPRPSQGTFRWFEVGGSKLLRLDLPNWVFIYTISDGQVSGPRQGTFSSLYDLDSERMNDSRNLHFLLLDEHDELVLEVKGLEVGFHKKARRTQA